MDYRDDGFEDLGLWDLITAGKRVSRRKLERLQLEKYQAGFLSRGVQPFMDQREQWNGVVETAIGYAGAVGVMVMDEIADNVERIDVVKMEVDHVDERVNSLVRERDTLREELDTLWREMEEL